jgi:hypothetical protein
VIFVVNNFSSEKHELVIKKLVAPGKEGSEIIRNFDLVATQSINIRMKLEAGEYVIYCTIKKGLHSHRKSGEEAIITVR